MDESGFKSGRVEYVAPPDDVFSRLANAVCSELSRRKNDVRFLDPDITGGLAAFLKLVAVIEVHRLNKGSPA
ncbi:MAG: hypothetical protein U0452_05575 [Anaerolineae bacterium]